MNSVSPFGVSRSRRMKLSDIAVAVEGNQPASVAGVLYHGRAGFPRAGLAALWAEGQIPKPRLGAQDGDRARTAV